jgi:uncharacterized damage-inducible protein DinB
MNFIIESTLKTLNKSKSLLSKISDEQLCNTSVSPYYSSIGSHVRHILDFYECILNCENNLVDLTDRKRDQNVENLTDSALEYLEVINQRLKLLTSPLDQEIIVVDDMGMGKVKIKYTLSSLLAQANSHTIHHYAIINYILDGLNIEFNEEQFGLNPTTQRKIVN